IFPAPSRGQLFLAKPAPGGSWARQPPGFFDRPGQRPLVGPGPQTSRHGRPLIEPATSLGPWRRPAARGWSNPAAPLSTAHRLPEPDTTEIAVASYSSGPTAKPPALA